MKKIGILFHPKLNEAKKLSELLAKSLGSSGCSVWYGSAWEEEQAKVQLNGTELVISIGGDGTVLRTARVVLSRSIPILGINMGRIGFMTEISAREAEERLPSLLNEPGRIEERAMLQATSNRTGQTLHALNDVVVARGSVARAITVEVNIDGEACSTHRADAVIAATATGSTAYALAAGGPVLHPESKEMLLQPVAAHLGLGYGMVLPASTIIKMTVRSYHKGLLSIDGQNNPALEDGEQIEIKQSPFQTLFLRFKPRQSFYSTLAQRLVDK